MKYIHHVGKAGVNCLSGVLGDRYGGYRFAICVANLNTGIAVQKHLRSAGACNLYSDFQWILGRGTHVDYEGCDQTTGLCEQADV